MKIIYFIIPILAFISYSCSPIPLDCICTAEFRMYSVYILRSDGQPVDSLITWVNDQRTGAIYRVDSSMSADYLMVRGRYIVLTDGEIGYFSTTPKAVIFHASNQNYNITEQFFFHTDDCKCHLGMISGPDTIIVN
jgi:hypothetical protein